MEGLQDLGKHGKPFDQTLVENYVDAQPLGVLKGIARRVMMDIMKAPRGGAPFPAFDRSASSSSNSSKKKKKSTPKKAKTPAKKSTRASSKPGKARRSRTRSRRLRKQ